MDETKLRELRRVIGENLRIQRGGAKPITYIDLANVLSDVSARQNHTIFGRRGCGKTLVLHHSAQNLDDSIKAVYLNCEDFKNHSYPNVLIEILEALFLELEKHLTGWFGRKKKSKELIRAIIEELRTRRTQQDQLDKEIRTKRTAASALENEAGLKIEQLPLSLSIGNKLSETDTREIEEQYKLGNDKIRDLNTWLPRLKNQIREFFAASSNVNAVFLQIDDFYHLNRADQPLVIDFIHRLCKDLPLFFKLATLRHASTLYVDRLGQPVGAQERHDYQPINIDFTFADFRRTVSQNREILRAYGKLCRIDSTEVDTLFKGDGFERLILAGGGVPRDCLSLFLELLSIVTLPDGDGRIGKDDVRALSRANFERRIEELKQDSGEKEQGTLLRGIYVLRQLCITDLKTNVILVSEAVLQKNPNIRALLYRLLDYRIIHSAGSAFTHKSQPGTFHAFAIDVGSYAHFRTMNNRFTEIDLNADEAKERMRSAPVLNEDEFTRLWKAAPTASDELNAVLKMIDEELEEEVKP